VHGQHNYQVSAPKQRPLRHLEQWNSIARMRLGVMHDNCRGDTNAMQREDHQQIERTWHGTHGELRVKAAQVSAKLHDGDRGLYEPPCQPGHPGIGFYGKLTTCSVQSMHDFRAS
jgi:hypothetical protein